MAAPADTFAPPGIIKVSSSALRYAREFFYATKNYQRRDWVVTFDWATSMKVRHRPDEPYEDIEPCVTLGAFERHQIPAGFIHTINGLELAIQIPKEVWEKSVHRLIDYDENLLFKLALR